MYKKATLTALLLFVINLYPATSCAEFSFNGEINFNNETAEIVFHRRENESAILSIGRKTETQYFSLLDIKNLATRFFDISTILENAFEVKKSPEGLITAITGELVSRYTLINHKPVEEFRGYFDYEDAYLTFRHLSIGNVICSGRLKLKSPLSLNLRLAFSNVNLADAIYFFTLDETIDSSGFLEGEVNIAGEIPYVQISGNFKSELGVIGKLAYKRIGFDFQGRYPLLQIVDSSVIREDGHIFKILGRINISDRGHYREQIARLKMEPVISWKGDNLEWTLKRVESEGNSGSTEIKYQIRKQDDINTLSEEKSDLLGIERKVLF